MAYFYFGKSRVFPPRLIGSFIVVLAVIMFVVAAGKMFDSWDSMQRHPSCIAKIGSETDQVAMMKYLDCKDSLYRISGLQLRPDQHKITERQFLITLLTPIAELLFWAAVLLAGMFLYSTRIVRPGNLEPKAQKRKK